MYTVVQNSTVANPTYAIRVYHHHRLLTVHGRCQNVTFPPPLKVDATVPAPQGPMSQFGFINQVSALFKWNAGLIDAFGSVHGPLCYPPVRKASVYADCAVLPISLSSDCL